ncbi:MAG TPA: helix-turn-helix domain-containing protein [Solirubrobacterales bacterium]|nr:helix-turn-helix domain-containing protein [Solirubrobacterales bacterium]
MIDLIEGDLECLIEDLSVKPLADQSVEEMLRNRDVLVWLRGGPLPDEGAVELLETNLAVFFRAPATDEEANAAALRAALDELRRAQAVARAAGDFWSDRDAEASGFTQRERSRLGDRLDDLRKAKGMTVGNLAERSGVDVVTIVATIYGADEVGTLDLMYLAGALEVEPRELFPECSGSAEDEEEGNRPSGPSDGPGGDS